MRRTIKWRRFVRIRLGQAAAELGRFGRKMPRELVGFQLAPAKLGHFPDSRPGGQCSHAPWTS